ncbi:MAG TPA: DEAD/DEAH box helicase family protein [Candidatus Kapabacteria bacterium]|nr:DEAD/DEAH box helicase family protein [Candidatus Kapabacteria bacterium]
MRNVFLPYEEDFQEWDRADFPNVNPLTEIFLDHLRTKSGAKKLWDHQIEGIEKAIYSYELLQLKKLLLNIVTGGGKTSIIAAVIAWLKYAHQIDKFVILCPNTIVRDRLQDDFTDAKVFREFALFPPGSEHYTNELQLHVMERASGPSGILDSGVILGNVQQLYQVHKTGQRNLAVLLRSAEEIAVFNDEAHNTPAPEYDNILYALSKKSKFRLDTTATPDRADGKNPDSEMIFEFSIADAQATAPPIIKSVVVYQPKISSVQLSYTNSETGERRTVDEMDEEFEKIEKGLSATQWVTDPDPMSKQVSIALERLEEQKRRAEALAHGSYKPILFVVGICINDARAAANELRSRGVETLLLTEESEEEDRLVAGVLGKTGNDLEEARKNLKKRGNLDPSLVNRVIERGAKVDAVVSVLMLREGWDVPAVCVILLLRKFSSRVYGQQVVGRGLRLNQRNEDAQEFCAIVDHERLNHKWLWDLVGAVIRKDVDQGDLFGVEEDLPPKRLLQDLVNPDLLIKVPDPTKEVTEKLGLEEFDKITTETHDYSNWEAILQSFDYSADVEISNVEIESVRGTAIGSAKMIELLTAPVPTISANGSPLLREDLVDILKNSIRDIARSLLADEGIGSHELGYFYGVLMDHVRAKLLNGLSVGSAPQELLIHALHHRNNIVANLQSYPGLVGSIVEHKHTASHANE